MINKGKRLAQIDDDNYEEDFEEVNINSRQVKTTKRTQKQLSEEHSQGDGGAPSGAMKGKNKSVSKIVSGDQRSRSIGNNRESDDGK